MRILELFDLVSDLTSEKKYHGLLKLSIAFLLLGIPKTEGLAQAPRSSNQTSTNYQTQSLDTINLLPPKKFYFQIINPLETKLDSTEGLTLEDIQYFYTQKNQNHFVNTGNYGSSSYPLIYKPEANLTFNVGYSQYDPYLLNADNYKFYFPERPISNLYFSQFGNQRNIRVGANYGAEFEGNTAMNITYNRMSHAGYYPKQSTIHSNFGIGLQKVSESGKHRHIAYFIHNAVTESHNGGILADSFLINRFRTGVPVVLDNAITRHQRRNMGWLYIHRLKGNNPSSTHYNIINHLSYNPSYYKFSDKNIDEVTYASTYPFISDIDSRGIRSYTDVQEFSENISLSIEKANSIRTDFGISYHLFAIIQDGLRQRRSDAVAHFKGNIPIYKVLDLALMGKLGLLTNFGNFDIGGQLHLNLKKNLNLSINLNLYRNEPSLISRQFFISAQEIFSNNFSKPFGSVIGAKLEVPKIGFSAEISQSIVNNPIYWGTDILPQQSQSIFSHTYLKVGEKLKLWKIHTENNFHLQLQSQALYAIPQFFSNHQLYYKDIWFNKALEVMLGGDARWIPAYIGTEYNPALGYFFVSNSKLENNLSVHGFFAAKASSFKFMFIVENLQQYINQIPKQEVIRHPQFDPRLRFSIMWQLLD